MVTFSDQMHLQYKSYSNCDIVIQTSFLSCIIYHIYGSTALFTIYMSALIHCTRLLESCTLCSIKENAYNVLLNANDKNMEAQMIGILIMMVLMIDGNSDGDDD